MSDLPARIAVWPDFVGHPSMTGQWSANTHPDNAVAYVRADLSDALLRDLRLALVESRARAEKAEVERERLLYVLDGVAGAIDTGRNEPLQVWRDQINIARQALKGQTND